jgi:hypothetical protein
MPRLVDLHPRWARRGGRDDGGIYGITFDCPCGTPPLGKSDKPGCPWGTFHILFCNPLDGGPPEGIERQQWAVAGTSFDHLTLSPSIRAGDHWHGWVRDGSLETC